MLRHPPNLDDLIELVNSRAGAENGLARLSEAASLSRELNSLTDRLLDHFVHQAREAGMSWSQIGQQLGVSKQGAQQRFTEQSKLEDLPHQLRELGASLEEKLLARGQNSGSGLLQKMRSTFKPQRFTAAARQVVILAQEEARDLKHDRIGAEHILLALMREETGVATSTLRSLGLTLERVRSKVAEKTEPSPAPPSGHIPFTSGARAALETAMTESANLKHSYIGTEHVLLGVLKEETMAREVLKELDIHVDSLTEEVARLLERL